ncbi:MAG: hypothetical protein LBI30_01560 [Holosporales bacterium]|jgi:hypothetical protein|nr:hypothetical protein [Holosporales bacterium]
MKKVISTVLLLLSTNFSSQASRPATENSTPFGFLYDDLVKAAAVRVLPPPLAFAVSISSVDRSTLTLTLS